MSRVLLRGFLLCLGLLISIPALAQDPAAKPKSRFEQLIEKKKKMTGMWTLYYSDQQVLAEMNDTILRREYIIIPSIARGISQGIVLGGMSWNFEEDAIWFFRKSEEKLFIYQRNVRFRAKANTPEAAAVDLAYSDSILYSLPILTTSPTGGFLVDLTSVFMNDELKIGAAIGPSFRFVQDRSTITKMKTFENNIEMQINAVYSGSTSLDTVPNPRGVQVGVHYSISVLPPVGANGYKPRVADDRVGYFITAIKDFSDQTDPDHFVRYANRWNLQKLDPSIELSPPREPIRFFIEDTVPVALRPTVEAGILEWNKAFEKLGFSGAIKVDQQPTGDPNFDPENVKYNTFRWMTADAGFAMGPSRVDPRTGEILDADIIFDSSFLKSWSTRWEVYRGPEPEKEGEKTSVNNLFHNHDHSHPGSLPFTNRHATGCSFCAEKQRLNGVAAAMLVASGVAAEGHLPKEFIHEGLKEVVMHEVGHTLGLRHNFKASAWKSLEQIGDNEAGKKEGIVASVMDYAPPNIAEDRTKQGLYYTQTIGPYDYWAIEYGYKPITSNEAAELKKIASRSNEPALAYTTDEDTRSFDPDPLSARFDLGSDPIAYSRRQMKMATDAMPKIIDRTVKTGDGYQRARQAFNLLFHEYWNAANIAVRYPGGVELSRDHKPEKPEDARAPFVTVSPEKQREAMKLINDSAFAPPAVNGKELNFLAASRWSHWGTSEPIRQDIAIHDDILLRQDIILGNLLSSLRLSRIQDNEFKAPAGEDAYTLVEHLQLIVDGIFSEWKVDPAKEKYEDRDPLISSFRRNLQRQAIRRIGTLLTQGGTVPSDAKNLLRVHLQELHESAKKLSERQGVILDKYTKAHLADSIARIDSILKAELVVPNVN
ncbi:zinc-dependent metalloprotease [Planctomicrobium sp. SH527]|uniref:zinc-dependent metalloprotease n=1 Tax=Planctomicrobium sp. SH527 TaxID=3448123 RepID=UPI003F5B27E3